MQRWVHDLRALAAMSDEAQAHAVGRKRLFTFSRALTGGYYFCPPVVGGKLDLRTVLR